MILEICRLSDPELLKRYDHSGTDRRREIINGLP